MPPDYADLTLHPAQLLRRMAHPVCVGPQRLRLDAQVPALRLPVEAARGSLTIELTGPTVDSPIPTGTVQWFQNGTAIPGATDPTLHLAGLSVDDTDLYFAELTTATTTLRSQPCVVVIYPGHPLANLAVRGHVAPDQPFTASFVIGRGIGPVRPKRYLLRAIGPSLQRFGVTTPLPNPVVRLARRSTPCDELLQCDPERVQAAAQAVGAFAVEPAAGDFSAVADLPPGAYSLVVSAASSAAGEALVEVYEVDR